MQIVLNLPPPPSNNSFYRRAGHMIYLSPTGRKYKEDVALIVKSQTSHHFGDARLKLHVDYTPNSLRREDLDNKFKAICDSLKVIYDDDSQIDCLSITRRPKDKENAGIIVTIEEIKK